MIRDHAMRLVFIPLLGIGISYLSGLISYQNYNTIENAAAGLYFIGASYLIWRGCQWIHVKLRRLYPINQKTFSKLLSISAITAVYGSAIMTILALLWMRFSREPFSWFTINKAVLASTLAVIVFTLVYEILYLSKEREIDNKIVNQLDQELTQAEMLVLRNELDPHFIFNSLNTLIQLITQDCDKAVMFTRKLSEVYKYFLINKNKELVSMSEELEFIRNYHFLLQIRHDDKIKLRVEMDEEKIDGLMIIPCALQILVENAIKHNQFTERDPLHINIKRETDFLIVKNNMKTKKFPAESTRIGLRNLNSQYQLAANKPIITNNSDHHFIVKIPIIQIKNQPA